MASIYRRNDSQNFSLSCYPRSGAKLVRASLGTDNEEHARQVARKVDLLIELERMSGIEVPVNVLASFHGVRDLMGPCLPSGRAMTESTGIIAPPGKQKPDCPIDDVIRAYLVRSTVANVHHGCADKISRLRQFFGSERINALDPRPPEVLGRKKKRIAKVPPWFAGDDLAQITSDTILLFFSQTTYSRSSKRHFRELFHELFQYALKTGAYRLENPYAANPADDLPSFKGTGEPITVLTRRSGGETV